MDNDDFYINLFETNKPDYIICADGGARHLRRLGFIPDIIVGDLDSIGEKELKYYRENNVDIRKYPTEKDETDTQLAIRTAMGLPVNEIVLLGAIGSRMDHTLANLYLLQSIVEKNYKACIINERNTIYLIDKRIELEGEKGTLISLLPFSDQVTGITTKGLYYALNDDNMHKDNPYGVSNRFVEDSISISIDSGFLLVILSVD